MSAKIDWASLKTIFKAYPNVIAAWCFGSSQDGWIGEQSDVDIAVLFRAVPPLDDLVSLQADLEKTLQFDRVDLVILNDASPITRFEAVSGRPVFCHDLSARAEFVSLTAREYEDAIAFIQQGLRSYSPARG
jgi:predicted nucleotidyltransferase